MGFRVAQRFFYGMIDGIFEESEPTICAAATCRASVMVIIPTASVATVVRQIIAFPSPLILSSGKSFGFVVGLV